MRVKVGKYIVTGTDIALMLFGTFLLALGGLTLYARFWA